MTKWRKYNGALIPDQPPHIEVNDSDSLIKKKIRANNAYFSRWTSDFDCDKETNFWYVICDISLELKDYSLNTRSKIKRGLNHCSVRKISHQELLADGYKVYKSAFERYNTSQKIFTDHQFKESILQLTGKLEFWGVYFNDILIGYSQNKIDDMTCEYSVIKFHPKYLTYYSSYALFYSMNRHYLNENNYKYVNDGSRSISHETNIQSYLIRKFQFRKSFCKLHIEYSTPIQLLIYLLYPIRDMLFKYQHQLFIKINILLKQESILRNYIIDWRVYNGAIIPTIPPHCSVKESVNSIKKKVHKTNTYFARWTSDFDCDNETEFWYIIKDSFNGIDEYSSNTRKSIRKGLKNIDVRIISKEHLISEGYEVYRQAFNRYNTHIVMKSENEFINEIEELLDTWDYWGAFTTNGIMIAFSMNQVVDGSCNFSATKFHPSFLKLRTSDVLFFKMTEYYLNNLGLKYITGGTRSMSHDTNIQTEYIRKFKFRKAYCRLNVVYSFWIGILIKIIYPFKNIFYLFNNRFITKIQTLIEHEKIRRSYA